MIDRGYVLSAGLASVKYRWFIESMFWMLDWRQWSTGGTSSLCFECWIDISELQVVHRGYVLSAGLTSVKYRWYIEAMFWVPDWRQWSTDGSSSLCF